MPAAVVVPIKMISHSRWAALCLLDLYKHHLRVFVQLSQSFCLPPVCLSL